MSNHDTSERRAVTITTLRKLKQEGKKIVSLTAYDASFARILDDAGVEVILVGDSLGMVIQGHGTTVPVSMDEMVYHTRAVARAANRALIMADLPFMSYATHEQGLQNAARLMREGHAHMVKIEGGIEQAELITRLAELGVPVCAHIGLTPQAVHKLGGFRVQGREDAQGAAISEAATTLEQAGADILLVECVPSELASEISNNAEVPVIGIGAGPDCDGQILVLYDVLGIAPGKPARFAKDFVSEAGTIAGAITAFADAVRSGAYPSEEHTFR